MSRWKAGGLSLYPSDLLGRLQWTLKVGRWVLHHRRHPGTRVLCQPQLVEFKSALRRQHSKSIIERSVFVEKQAPNEMLQKHSYAGKTAAKGQQRDIYSLYHTQCDITNTYMIL